MLQKRPSQLWMTCSPLWVGLGGGGGGDRRECLIVDLAAEICRSPVDAGVTTRGTQFVQRLELRVDSRVNRAQQWFGRSAGTPLLGGRL